MSEFKVNKSELKGALKQAPHMSQFNRTTIDYTPRTEQRGGRTYTVVPVVMMVEGVHAGSQGPILHLPEYYSQDVSQWDGVPATVGHPQIDGQFVMANDAPSDEWVVGFIDNTHIEDNKLKAEVWIDQQRAVAVNPEVLNYINEGRALDVSTGLISRDMQKQGEHNGERYDAITVEYTADHLALLPGDEGACSWTDGCGIRTNKREEDSNEMNKLTEEQIQALKSHNSVRDYLQANEMGFMEISSKLQTQLDRLDSDARIHFLKEVYDDAFVYEVRDRDQGSSRFYRQQYEAENNEVAMQSDPTEVRRNIEYVPIQSNQDSAKQNNCGCEKGGKMKRTKYNTNTNSEDDMPDTKDKRPSGEVMDKVSALVNNESTRFTKDDREWLLELNEAQLNKLEPSEPEQIEVTRDQALQALSADLADKDKLIEILPEGTRKHFETGMKAYEEQRSKLIKTIQSNTAEGTWPKDELEELDMQMLERIAKSVRSVDYSGRGAGGGEINVNEAGDDVEMMLPAGVELKS